MRSHEKFRAKRYQVTSLNCPKRMTFQTKRNSYSMETSQVINGADKNMVTSFCWCYCRGECDRSEWRGWSTGGTNQSEGSVQRSNNDYVKSALQPTKAALSTQMQYGQNLESGITQLTATVQVAAQVIRINTVRGMFCKPQHWLSVSVVWKWKIYNLAISGKRVNYAFVFFLHYDRDAIYRRLYRCSMVEPKNPKL